MYQKELWSFESAHEGWHFAQGKDSILVHFKELTKKEVLNLLCSRCWSIKRFSKRPEIAVDGAN